MAINRSLTWFYVVLSGVLLAYCVTNVPVLVKRRSIVKSAFCASVMVYVVLYACNWFVGGDWLFSFAFPVATLSLFFGWVIVLILLSRIRWLFKIASMVLVAGIANLVINPWINYLINNTWNLSNNLGVNLLTLHNAVNVVSFISCTVIAVFLFKKGIYKRRTVNETKEHRVIDLTSGTNGNNPGK